MIKGVDISRYQTPVNFATMKAGGIEFAIFRGYFDTIADKTFPVYHADAVKEGLIRGVYHFVDYRDNPVSQAALLGLLYNQYPCEAGAWCDLEYYQPFGTFTRANILSWLYRYFSEVEDKTGRVCGLYANANMVASVLKPVPRWLLEKPLWIAHWGNSLTAPLIGEWPSWVFWQHTDKGDGKALGVSSLDLDMDRYNGSLSDLRAWCGMEVITPMLTLEARVARLEKAVFGAEPD